MKGAFETFLIFLLGMTFVLMGFSMVETTMKYNSARLFQENIVSLIERHNRYDEDVDDLINELDSKCYYCSYEVRLVDNQYLVSVNFKVLINVINYSKIATIKSFTQKLV